MKQRNEITKSEQRGEITEQIVTALHNKIDAINSTVDYLTAVGVKNGVGGVVEDGKAEFIKFRCALAAEYYGRTECTKDHADKVAREFLGKAGYRERAERVIVKAKAPTQWERAKAESVKRAKVGKNILLNGVEYAPLRK